MERSNGAVKTAFDIQVNGKRGPGRPKMTWKQLTERDRRAGQVIGVIRQKPVNKSFGVKEPQARHQRTPFRCKTNAGDWVKCVTRTHVGKPVLGFYESLENMYSSKTNAIKA